jgi:hypothetical protein
VGAALLCAGTRFGAGCRRVARRRHALHGDLVQHHAFDLAEHLDVDAAAILKKTIGQHKRSAKYVWATYANALQLVEK